MTTEQIKPVALPSVVMPTPEPAPAPEAPKKPKVMIADLFSDLLRDAGHANPEAWKETPFGSIHPDHVYCDEPLQRFHVNRQLRIILGKASQVLGVDTINMRGMLMDEQDVTAREWSAPVKNSIVPFFIKHNLPVSTAEVE